MLCNLSSRRPRVYCSVIVSYRVRACVWEREREGDGEGEGERETERERERAGRFEVGLDRHMCSTCTPLMIDIWARRRPQPRPVQSDNLDRRNLAVSAGCPLLSLEWPTSRYTTTLARGITAPIKGLVYQRDIEASFFFCLKKLLVTPWQQPPDHGKVKS